MQYFWFFQKKVVLFDILPRLKSVGFLASDAPADDLPVSGLTGARQFEDAPSKYIPCRVQVPVVHRTALWAHPLAVSQGKGVVPVPAFAHPGRRVEPVNPVHRAAVLGGDHAQDFHEPAVGKVVHLPAPPPAHAREVKVLHEDVVVGAAYLVGGLPLPVRAGVNHLLIPAV